MSQNVPKMSQPNPSDKNPSVSGFCPEPVYPKGCEIMPHRTDLILDLVGIALEAKSRLAAAGLQPTLSEAIELARLVQLREAEVRKMQFMARERELTCERREQREETVN
jgi:hypothetical protein